MPMRCLFAGNSYVGNKPVVHTYASTCVGTLQLWGKATESSCICLTFSSYQELISYHPSQAQRQSERRKDMAEQSIQSSNNSEGGCCDLWL